MKTDPSTQQESIFRQQQEGYAFLERERKLALRAMTHDDTMRAMSALFGRYIPGGVKQTCGLIAWQAMHTKPPHAR